MSKHKHAEIIKAKADDMDLVLFRKTPTSEVWEICRYDWMPTDLQDSYFASLPQHKEACLHWLNGGDVEFRRGDGEWQDECEKYHGWANYCGMMNCDVEFRIKPRKEKRYLYVSKEGCTTYAKKTKEEAAREVNIMGGSFDVWKLHELEIEV